MPVVAPCPSRWTFLRGASRTRADGARPASASVARLGPSAMRRPLAPAMAESQPAGCRLVFRTRATAVELDALRTQTAYRGAPTRPDGVYDLLVDGPLTGRTCLTGGNVLMIDRHRRREPARAARHRPLRRSARPREGRRDLAAAQRDHRTDRTAHRRTRWSRPDHSAACGCTTAVRSATAPTRDPTGTWPALAAAAGDVELINLGHGRSALLDPFTARTMRDTPADLISIKIGINLVNADLMRVRAFRPAVHGFLDTIREGHPATPILSSRRPVLSHPRAHSGTDAHDFSSGTMAFVATGDPAETTTGKLTLSVIRHELTAIVTQRATSDPNIHYLNGLKLYGPADFAEFPLADKLHPSPQAHQRIGGRFASGIREIVTGCVDGHDSRRAPLWVTHFYGRIRVHTLDGTENSTGRTCTSLCAVGIPRRRPLPDRRRTRPPEHQLSVPPWSDDSTPQTRSATASTQDGRA